MFVHIVKKVEFLQIGTTHDI